MTLDNFVNRVLKKYRKGYRAIINLKYLKKIKIMKYSFKKYLNQTFKSYATSRLVNEKKRRVLKKGFRYNLFDDNY